MQMVTLKYGDGRPNDNYLWNCPNNILFSYIYGHPNYRALSTTFMVILMTATLYIPFVVT